MNEEERVGALKRMHGGELTSIQKQKEGKMGRKHHHSPFQQMNIYSFALIRCAPPPGELKSEVEVVVTVAKTTEKDDPPAVHRSDTNAAAYISAYKVKLTRAPAQETLRHSVTPLATAAPHDGISMRWLL